MTRRSCRARCDRGRHSFPGARATWWPAWGEREESLTVWIRAAAADGRLKTSDPTFASQQLQGLVKAFVFWPQVTMGQPPLSKDEQRQVAESAVDMLLARYA